MKMNNLKRTTKRFILIGIDAMLLLIALQLSYGFIDFFASVSIDKFLITYVILLFSYFCVAFKFKIFSIINRYTDYNVLLKLSISVTVAYVIVLGSSFFFPSFSYRFLFLGWFFSIPILMLPRIIWRVISEKNERSTGTGTTEKVRTLVIGAG